MRDTVVKINKTKSWFFEKVKKLTSPQQTRQGKKKKKRRVKSKKLEVKKERLHQTRQKYKGL